MRRARVHSVTSLLERGSRSRRPCLPACRQVVARSHTCKRPLYLRFKRGPFCVVVSLPRLPFSHSLSLSLSRPRLPSATYLSTFLFTPSRRPCHAIARALVISSVFLFTSLPPPPRPPPSSSRLPLLLSTLPFFRTRRYLLV